MKKNKKYLQAAMLLSKNANEYFDNDGKYFNCCAALITLNHNTFYFSSLFKPDYKTSTEFWWSNYHERTNDQLARQIALLLMYEMGEK